MTSWADILRQVEERAHQRCEYCGMHQALQGATFHVEHIAPTSRGGSSELHNLAWACPACNLHKSNRTHGVDSVSNDTAPLFNPRDDAWTEHFLWQGHEIVGLTPTGRATITALDLNHPRRLLIRQAEEVFGLFPP